jgi:hypothetical protein
MTKSEERIIVEHATEKGILPGTCPVCKTQLVPSNRVLYGKVPEMTNDAISFDCPNSRDHIQPSDLVTYRISKGGTI